MKVNLTFGGFCTILIIEMWSIPQHINKKGCIPMTVSTKTKKACATGLAGIALAAGANIAGVATASAAPAKSVAVHTFPSTAAPTVATIKNPDCRNLAGSQGHQANGHNWVMVRSDNGVTGWAIDEGNTAWCI